MKTYIEMIEAAAELQEMQGITSIWYGYLRAISDWSGNEFLDVLLQVEEMHKMKYNEEC